MHWETFTPLEDVACVTHAFTLRTANGLKTDTSLSDTLESIGLASTAAISAEQPHGAVVRVVNATHSNTQIPKTDSLITKTLGLPLLIRCADCAAIYIVNTTVSAIALIHSGKRGTEKNIVAATLTTMKESCNANPHDCIAVISPCIGPCHYEVNLWDTIEAQLKSSGVKRVFNQRVCTACHLDRYFSYRSEQGNTGRMHAIIALNSM